MPICAFVVVLRRTERADSGAALIHNDDIRALLEISAVFRALVLRYDRPHIFLVGA